MRLSATAKGGLARSIDGRWAPERSIVLRYAPAVRLCEDAREDAKVRARLEPNSLGEGARIVPLAEVRGAELWVLDETSRMATGSLKAVDGCLTASLLQASGVPRVAFESGGNTGAALTAYGRRAGIETFCFCPNGNLDLLDSRLFQGAAAHLIGVRDPAAVKDLTALFADRIGILRVPLVEWRLGASLFRGLFLLESLLQGRRWDWLVQTVSAGFGPIGIYRALREFAPEVGALPRLLAVQQAANAPVYRAWKGGPADGRRRGEGSTPGLLSRVMYDVSPQTYGTLEELEEILTATGGDVLTVDEGEFDLHVLHGGAEPSVPALLGRQGIRISRRDGAILDKTGLICVAGALKAVEQGIIPPGSRVLCCLTSGVSRSDGRAAPEAVLGGEEDALRYAEVVGRYRGG